MKGHPVGQLKVVVGRGLLASSNVVPVAVQEISCHKVACRSKLPDGGILFWDICDKVGVLGGLIIQDDFDLLRGFKPSQLRVVVIVPKEPVVIVPTNKLKRKR